MIAFDCLALGCDRFRQRIPKDATICPKEYDPPLFHCNARFVPPLPVCQYLRDGKIRQAYNHGCEYMCAEDVKAYKNGVCDE